MSDSVSALYLCDACGKTAGSVELSVTPEERLCLRVIGPVADTKFFLDRDARQGILTVLRDEGPLSLYQIHSEYAPFFCPDCAKNYCKDCWRMTPIFDEDFPGWYDCTEGYCPQGHRRILDD
jgi:hypothetical protein